MSEQQPKVLFVCMGNICRSPTAHAIFRQLVNDKKLNIGIDSCGTIGYHQGNSPDSRSAAAGKMRGYDFSGLYSRKIRKSDFVEFDYILAMDNANLDLKAQCPQQYLPKVQLMLDYSSTKESEVPDPYYGGEGGFAHVLDLLEDACQNLLRHIQNKS